MALSDHVRVNRRLKPKLRLAALFNHTEWENRSTLAAAWCPEELKVLYLDSVDV